jgi:hypothetical protein
VAPLAIDLFCGLGGWTEGLLAEGYDVVGFDIHRHEYGEHRYPAQLVIQDVLTLHGSQFKGATLIVASPPCQAYSYRAMPWSRAKALPPPDNTLFDACFRIQREAIEAAGRHIPLVVENVRGAQKWVGRARWNFGSFYLWGDVPALMPPTFRAVKAPGMDWNNPSNPNNRRSFTDNGMKNAGFRFDGSGRSFQSESVKTVGHLNVRDGHAHTKHLTNPGEHGVKHRGSGAVWFDTGPASLPSSSPRRKMASAMIAKIPLPLSRHIARAWHPLAMGA